MSKDLLKDSTVTLLYHPPMQGARTGHCGLLITAKNDPKNVILYFSLYHNYKPSEVRKKSWPEKFHAIDAAVVDSYKDDVLMRGQSWDRLDKKEEEDISVGALLKTLPNSLKIKKIFLQKGQFKHALSLSSIDAEAVFDEMNRIKQTAKWAMFAPLSQFLFQDKNAYNCCSAIRVALEKGQSHTMSAQSAAFIQFSTLIACAAMILFSMIPILSLDNPTTALLYSPFLYLTLQLAHSIKNAYHYSNDLMLMAKHTGKISLSTQFMAYSICMLINVLGSPFSRNMSSQLFTFPSDLYRMAQALEGQAERKSEKHSNFARKLLPQ